MSPFHVVTSRRNCSHRSDDTFFFILPRTISFLAACQIFGIGIVSPIYFSLSILSTDPKTATKEVRYHFVRALPTACQLCYVVPSIMMFLPPFSTPLAAQNTIALWQASPILVAVVASVLAALIKRPKSHEPGLQTASITVEETSADPMALKYLHRLYKIVFTVALFMHITLICYIWDQPDLTLTSVFFDIPSPHSDWDLSDQDTAICTYMKFNLAFCVMSTVVYMLYIVWDMRLVDQISKQEAISATAGIFAGQLLIGPAATYIGIWRWRERIMSRVRAFQRG